jgi:hypothetical protein
MQFVHNSNVFFPCIIHILYTGCAKIKKIIPAPKVWGWINYLLVVLHLSKCQINFERIQLKAQGLLPIVRQFDPTGRGSTCILKVRHRTHFWWCKNLERGSIKNYVNVRESITNLRIHITAPRTSDHLNQNVPVLRTSTAWNTDLRYK